MTHTPAMRIRHLIVAALTVAASGAEAQRPRWTFGPLWPHVEDAGKRTALGFGLGAAFMGLGLGMERVSRMQCTGNGNGPCFTGNQVQAGIGWAFLGTLTGATNPLLHSKCTRSGRAVLAIVGAVVGTSVAGTIVDSKMFHAPRGEPATFRTMGSGLLGMSAGAGIAAAIC
jgi:hypothetical protein